MTILLLLGGNFHTSIRHIEQHLPRYLSQHASVVCFEYPQFVKFPKVIIGSLPLLERVNANLIVFHSFGLLPGGRTITLINRINHMFSSLLLRLMLGKRFDIIISFTPELALVASLISSKKIIYHILDDYVALPWWGSLKSQRAQLRTLELYTVGHVHKIIAVSPLLVDRYKNQHPDVRLFPTPTYLKHYRSRKSHIIPDDIKDLPHPIIGFAGSASFESKLDVDLLIKLMQSYPNYTFVFTGIYIDDFIAKFKQFNNCRFLGFKSLSSLPHYIAHFDVCLVPYMTNQYGLSAYPVKIMEYLCLGKPIVTTSLPSVKFLANKNLIYWSRNKNEFIGNVGKAVVEKVKQTIKKERRRIALSFNWNNKIREYMQLITQ